MPKDRRDTPRIDIEDDLPGSITVVEPMRVAQISPTGVQIDTTAGLLGGTLHDIRLTLGAHTVVVKSRVVHSSVRQLHREQVFYRTGVEFIDLTERATRAIAHFIDALVRRRDESAAADPEGSA